MNNHPISLRRRLQALQAIPDSERTEAQWDELNELEITLAPGNRISPPRFAEQRPEAPGVGNGPRRAKPGAPTGPGSGPGPGSGSGEPRRKPVKRIARRPPKPVPPG